MKCVRVERSLRFLENDSTDLRQIKDFEEKNLFITFSSQVTSLFCTIALDP